LLGEMEGTFVVDSVSVCLLCDINYLEINDN